MTLKTSFSARRFGASIALTAACMANLVSAPATAAAPVPHILPMELSHHAFAAEVPRQIASAKLLGRATAQKRIKFSVILPLQHRAELDALIKVQSDRHSPQFRHWLTKGQFVRRFGADPKAVHLIEAALVADGAKVEHTNESKTIIAASAPVATVEKIFATKIGTFAAAGRQLYANMTPAQHPAEFHGAEVGVLGLDNFAHVMTFNTGFKSSKNHSRSAMPRVGKYGTDYASGNAGGYTSKDLSIAYNFPWRHYGNKTAGKGATIGIVMVDDYLDSDIKMYRDNNVDGGHRPSGNLTRVAIDGGGSFDPDVSGEVTLDVEQSTSLAPKANELVYETPDLSDQSIVDAYDAVVTDDIADVVNSSFGGCESYDSFDVEVDQAFAQGNSQGQTFFASSGDQGSACFPYYTTGVSMPSSDPYVVAVGGTTLATGASGEYGGEYAWALSGGGYSLEWGFPYYQDDINGGNLSQVTGVAPYLRNVPDIALNADNVNSPDEYSFNGAEGAAGGTSFSSPDATAAFAIIDGYIGGRVGLADAGLYSLASLFPLHDVAGGCNDYYAAGYCAAYGYDLVTGWGSFDADDLLQAFSGLLAY
jgi:subtilase family serine protease